MLKPYLDGLGVELIWGTASQINMVSRSLEKMMLIAIGLSAVVLVGMPILLFSINILNEGSKLQAAESFQEDVFTNLSVIEEGNETETTTQITVPANISLHLNGDSTLVITYYRTDGSTMTWEYLSTYPIALTPFTTPGLYLMQIELEEDILHLAFLTL